MDTGISFVVSRMNKVAYYMVSDDYFKLIGAKIVRIIPDHQKTARFINDRIGVDMSGIKILLCMGGVTESGQVDVNEYINKMDKVIRLIKTLYLDSEIMIKMHPRFNNKLSLEKELREAPSYLPARYLMQNVDIIIGHSTAALFEAANLGKKVVSLLEYMEAKDKRDRANYKKYMLNNSNNGIYFPVNDSEMMVILKDLRERALTGIEGERIGEEVATI